MGAHKQAAIREADASALHHAEEVAELRRELDAPPTCGDVYEPENGEYVSPCHLPKNHVGLCQGYCLGSRAVWTKTIEPDGDEIEFKREDNAEEAERISRNYSAFLEMFRAALNDTHRLRNRVALLETRLRRFERRSSRPNRLACLDHVAGLHPYGDEDAPTTAA